MLIETTIYIILAVILVGSAHVWSAIKSGCFYAATNNQKPEKLKKYINNLHYVQTPFWYSLFGAFGILLICIFRLMNPQWIVLDIVCAYLVAQGCSTIAGPLYQGYVNIGCGLPFVDENENKKMELANPFTGKTIWIKRFWNGRARVYLSIVGVLMVIAGIIIQISGVL